MEYDGIEPGPPLADRIRMARDLRQLTQSEVVERMPDPISAPALSQIEAAKVRPSQGTLQQLAIALEVPIAFFSTQWSSPEDVDPVTFFRDLRRTPVRVRRRASALAMLLNDLVAAIELHVRLPRVSVPERPVATDAEDDEIQEAAEVVRRDWGLGTDPLPHVVRELERHGTPVARLTFGHELVDGFSVRFSRRPIVLLASDKSNIYVRSRFDAAHELGHLVMHACASPRQRSVEEQAHDFASFFLLPSAAAERQLPYRLDAAGWARLADLKRHWGISMAALLYRAQKMSRISPDAYRSAMKYMSARGWHRTEPGDREMGPPEAPLLFERALKEVELETGAKLEDFIRSAHLPVHDMVDLIKAARDRRPVVEL